MRKFRRSTGLLLLFIALAIGLVGYHSASSYSRPDIHQELNSRDTVLLSSWSGVFSVLEDSISIGHSSSRYQVTCDSTRQVILEDQILYLEKRREGYGYPSKTYSLKTPQMEASYYEFEPNREVGETTNGANLLLDNPSETSFIPTRITLLMFAMGRGYSRFLGNFQSIKNDGNQYEITALGKKGFLVADEEGVWHIVVELPAYIVRKAEYSVDGRVLLRIENRGTLENALVAKQGTVTLYHSMERPLTLQVEVLELRTSFSGSLYQQVKQRIEKPDKDCEVWDLRVSPHRVTPVK